MIAKGKSISHSGNAINYAELKKDAQEISRKYLIGENGNEINREFRMVQDMNTKCEKNTFAFVVSPSPEDSLKVSDFQIITSEFLNKMKLSDQQHIAYLHTDNGKPHVHLYVNRIDMRGKAVPDKFISNRASRAGDEIAQKMGLRKANDLRQDKSLNNGSKLEFEKAHETAIKGKIKNFEDYQKAMKSQGYNIEKAVSKRTGKVSGLRVGKLGEKPIKISSVSRKVGTKLTKNFGAQLVNITPVGRILSVAKKTTRITKNISRGMGI